MVNSRNTPLQYGEEIALQLLDTDTFQGATSRSYVKTLASTAALISLFVDSTAGDVSVTVYNYSNDGREELVYTFPLTSAPTPSIIVARVNDISSHVRVQVDTTDSASIELKIKAAESISDSADDAQEVTDGINESAIAVQNPQITNVTMGAAGTETAVVLPAGTKRYAIKARGNSRLQFSYVSGETNTTYWTEFPGFTFEEDVVDRANTTVYVEANKNGEVLEIKTWT